MGDLDGRNLPLGLSNPQMNLTYGHEISSSFDVSSALAAELQRAVRLGNTQSAMDLARRLASIRPSISARLEGGFDSSTEEIEIEVNIYICDKNLATDDRCVTMKLQPTFTIETLKSMMFRQYRFLPELQKWIVGRRLASDGETLSDCGVNFNGAVIFLYLLTPKESLNRWDVPTVPVSLAGQNSLGEISPSIRNHLSFSNMPSVTVQASTLTQAAGGNLQPLQDLTFPQQDQVGWECPVCTFLNIPTRPGCEMCAAEKPIHVTTFNLQTDTL